jgi:hypothetical protein
MILTIPINPEMRIRLAYAEAIKLDISGHPELAELEADLVAAHAHIELLHKLMNDANQKLPFCNAFKAHRTPLCTAWAVVMNWEDSQCQL